MHTCNPSSESITNLLKLILKLSKFYVSIGLSNKTSVMKQFALHYSKNLRCNYINLLTKHTTLMLQKQKHLHCVIYLLPVIKLFGWESEGTLTLLKHCNLCDARLPMTHLLAFLFQTISIISTGLIDSFNSTFALVLIQKHHCELKEPRNEIHFISIPNIWCCTHYFVHI